MSNSIEDYFKIGGVLLVVLFVAHNFGFFNNQTIEKPIDLVDSVNQLVTDNKQLQSDNEILKKNLENTENYEYIKGLENRPQWIGVIFMTILLMGSIVIIWVFMNGKRFDEKRENRDRMYEINKKIETLPKKYQELFKEKEDEK